MHEADVSPEDTVSNYVLKSDAKEVFEEYAKEIFGDLRITGEKLDNVAVVAFKHYLKPSVSFRQYIHHYTKLVLQGIRKTSWRDDQVVNLIADTISMGVNARWHLFHQEGIRSDSDTYKTLTRPDTFDLYAVKYVTELTYQLNQPSRFVDFDRVLEPEAARRRITSEIQKEGSKIASATVIQLVGILLEKLLFPIIRGDSQLTPAVAAEIANTYGVLKLIHDTARLPDVRSEAISRLSADSRKKVGEESKNRVLREANTILQSAQGKSFVYRKGKRVGQIRQQQLADEIAQKCQLGASRAERYIGKLIKEGKLKPPDI